VTKTKTGTTSKLKPPAFTQPVSISSAASASRAGSSAPVAGSVPASISRSSSCDLPPVHPGESAGETEEIQVRLDDSTDSSEEEEEEVEESSKVCQRFV
jgi:hypothetical protein